MCKKVFKFFVAALMIAAVAMSCAKDGQDGKDGKDGQDGKDGINGIDGKDGENGSVVTIVDGYLYINGVNTGISTDGTSGSVVTIQDGYLYIDGENTGISADGCVCTMQDGYLYINGVNTGISVTGGGANVFIVSYDTDGATPAEVRSESVIAGGLAREPVTALTKTLNKEGLYMMDGNKVVFLGWYKVIDGVMESNEFDFDNMPITANTTLKAKWSVDLTQVNGTNIVDKTVTYINAHPQTYTLMLENNYEVVVRQTLNVADVRLTVKGLGSKRTITYTNPLQAEAFFHINASGVALILEENLVLTKTTEGIFLIHVQNGNLTLDGAEITGVTNTRTETWNSSVVYVTSATASFDMKSGKIHANTMRNTSAQTSVVQIYGGNPRFNMTGGEITGNSSNFGNPSTSSNPNAPADVFIQSSNFFLSGDAKIGSLILNRHQDNIKLTGVFGGAVDALQLHNGGDPWEDKNVIQGSGYTLTQADVDKFTLGNFRNTGEAISQTHELVLEGNNVVLRAIEP